MKLHWVYSLLFPLCVISLHQMKEQNQMIRAQNDDEPEIRKNEINVFRHIAHRITFPRIFLATFFLANLCIHSQVLSCGSILGTRVVFVETGFLSEGVSCGCKVSVEKQSSSSLVHAWLQITVRTLFAIHLVEFEDSSDEIKQSYRCDRPNLCLDQHGLVICLLVFM